MEQVVQNLRLHLLGWNRPVGIRMPVGVAGAQPTMVAPYADVCAASAAPLPPPDRSYKPTSWGLNR